MSEQSTSPSLRRRLVRGGLLLSAGRVFSQLSVFATHVLLAKFCLSPDDFGRYLAIAAIVQISAVVAGFGIPPIVMRTVRESLSTHDTRRTAEAIGRGLRLLISTALVVACLVGIGLFLVGPDPLHGATGKLAVLIGGWIFLAALNQFISDTFTGTEQYVRSILLGGESGGLIQNLVLMTGGCILGIGGWGSLLHVVILNLVGSGLATLVSLGRLRQVLLELRRTAAIENASTAERVDEWWIAGEGLPAMLRSLMRICMAQLDIVFVAAFLPATQVAAYGAARSLVRLVSSPLRLTNVAVAPFIPELNATGDKPRMESLLRAAATSSGVPAILALGALIVAPEFFLRNVFQVEFVSAACSLQVIAAGSIAFVAVGGVGMVLLMTGHQRVSLYSSLFIFMIQVTLTPFLIRQFGMVGAASASAFLIVTRSVVSMLLVRIYVGVWSTMTFSYRQIREFTIQVMNRRSPHLSGRAEAKGS